MELGQRKAVTNKMRFDMPSKPSLRTRTAEKYKDGLKKSGGAKAQRHGGPGRASKTLSTRKKLQP